jgi:plasmid stabilization system protein ParE
VQGRGLGLEFLRALEAELDTIARFPEGFSIVHGATRRALLSRFPYAVYFSSEPDVALVVAVLHTARDPRRIEERGG